MAVQIKYHNIIIPISKTDSVAPLPKFLRLLKKEGIVNSWNDGKLLVIGGIMSPVDVEAIVGKLETLGLNLLKQSDKETSFDDMCIIDFVNGSQYECPWLEYKLNPWEISYVWFKDSKIGDIISPPLT